MELVPEVAVLTHKHEFTHIHTHTHTHTLHTHTHTYTHTHTHTERERGRERQTPRMEIHEPHCFSRHTHIFSVVSVLCWTWALSCLIRWPSPFYLTWRLCWRSGVWASPATSAPPCTSLSHCWWWEPLYTSTQTCITPSSPTSRYSLHIYTHLDHSQVTYFQVQLTYLHTPRSLPVHLLPGTVAKILKSLPLPVQPSKFSEREPLKGLVKADR